MSKKKSKDEVTVKFISNSAVDVTGSAVLISYDNKDYLIEYGQVQGIGTLEQEYAINLQLSKNLNIDKSDIDALLFMSYTPDYLMPATSYILHKRLNLSNNCICMDIPQACSGYEIGLYQASMLINSGCKKVLLLVGDSFSKFTDMFNNNTAPVFGDAGSATLIEYDENAENS